jgi:type II secretory pathway predicted ATPase ExeA
MTTTTTPTDHASELFAEPSMYQLPIGFIPPAAQALLRDLPMPILRDGAGSAIAWSADVLHDVRTHRHIAAIVGEKGVGKTDGVELAVREFHTGERRQKLENDLYEEQRVVVVRTVRANDGRGFFHACYKAAFGVAMVDRARGRKRTTDELRDELIERARKQRIVAFVVDEAETLTHPILEAIRDLVSAAAASDASRLQIDASDSRARVRGIGVMLVGTPMLEETLRRHEEAGVRIGRIQRVTGIEREEVPLVLARLLPAFEQVAATEPDAWIAIVARCVPMIGTVPIGRLVRLARAYVVRMVAIASVDHVPMPSIEEIGFDELVFAHVADEARTAMSKAA